MNKRDDALREALDKNEEESKNWKTYLKENEQAIENMTIFGKQLTVDVMVPVGKKALMAGHLLHTNEVLVGHYQGYFSKCTTFKAKEICDWRIRMANDHIKKLETEASLWQNKLDKPYAEGVMPNGEDYEIIEEFNEETEKLWREKHRICVRLDKQKKRKERETQQKEKSKDTNTSRDKTNEEIFKMLEEAELIEELEQELDKLELDEVNNETIHKLMSGEMYLPRKKERLAHDKQTAQTKTANGTSIALNIVKRNDIKKSIYTNTNNNVLPNPVINSLVSKEHDDVDEVEIETLPAEVTLIKDQAKFLNAEDQIAFYEYHIQIIRQKLKIQPLRTQQELDEKIYLLNVVEHLEELLEGAEETVGTVELDDKSPDVENGEKLENQEKRFTDKNCQYTEFSETTKNKSDYKQKLNHKRRISFALEEETLEFQKHEAVAQMLPKIEMPERDFIKLNDKDEEQYKCELDAKNSLNKKDLIKSKVEKNVQFVEENQSKQDFDLVQQILQSSMGEINTLHIKFNHSKQESCQNNCKEPYTIPGSPADLYNLYLKSLNHMENVNEPSTLFINSYEGEDQVKAPALKEADRKSAFIDPKSQFSNPLQAKSILKNKAAVDKENHYQYAHQDNNKTKKSKKKSSKTEENPCLSAYNKVMHDVVERPLTEPEPLPDVKFIDAHTPKKRISRFKQMRQRSEQI